MDSEKPFDSLETEAMLEVERVEKFVWQVHVHAALMFRLEKEWRGPGRGLVATDNLHCLPRGAGLRPWMGGKGHPDQGARLWTMCQWHQLQSPNPDSKNPRTGTRYGKWAQREDEKIVFEESMRKDHYCSEEAVGLTSARSSTPRWIRQGCKKHTGSCWQMELPVLPIALLVRWRWATHLTSLGFSFFTMKLGIAMAGLKNLGRFNIL